MLNVVALMNAVNNNLQNGIDFSVFDEQQIQIMIRLIRVKGPIREMFKSVFKNMSDEDLKRLEWEVPYELYECLEELFADMNRNYKS